MKYENGDEVGLVEDDGLEDEKDVPFVDGVLWGALGTWGEESEDFGDGVESFLVWSMKLIWGGMMVILGLLFMLDWGRMRVWLDLFFERGSEVEGDPIFRDKNEEKGEDEDDEEEEFK